MSYGCLKKIDELGRVVIPKDVRRRLSIKKDDALEISIVNDQIIMKKSKTYNNFNECILKYVNLFCSNFDIKICCTDREKILYNNTFLSDDIFINYLSDNNKVELDNGYITSIIIDSSLEGVLFIYNDNYKIFGNLIKILVLNELDISL